MSKKPESFVDQDFSKIAGNAASDIKEFMSTIMWDVMTNKASGTGFARTVGRRLLMREISFVEKAEEPERKEGRVVIEITVDEGESRPQPIRGYQTEIFIWWYRYGQFF